MLVVWISIILAGASSIVADDCQKKSFGKYRVVCVCNSTQCHTIDPISPPEEKGFFLKYTSNRAGLRMVKEEGYFNSTSHLDNIIRIGNASFQTVLGFGGSFTDAAGLNILTLSEDAQRKLLRSYFAEEGLEYNIGRVPIGGTDFSTHGYSYHDDKEDSELRNFRLAEEDHKYKIPIIEQAIDISKVDIKLFSSAWIAPKWMKISNDYSGFFGYLKDVHYQTWADYMVRFLDEYKQRNISFWGITTGNEPSNGILGQQIPGVAWKSEKQKVWIAKNLGPALRSSQHAQIKIIALDDQRIYIPEYIDELFEEEGVEDYIDGIGVHWYADMLSNVSRLTRCHEKYPNKFILTTEVSKGAIFPEPRVLIGSWSRAEDYAATFIEDLNNWTVGLVDWNIALNMNGGPTYIDNNVDAPILIDATADEFYKQPMYYAISHFSKFAVRDSVRIDSSSSNTDLSVIAFRRPDGSKVVVILNRNGKNMDVTLENAEGGQANLQINKHSITTLVYI